ncbi:TetR/AcrR family transcriptional regulator [Natronorubrum daqingense]|uniref:TetR family transcriptional regulator n=1 Tax=Natronorubrum daqingense TaxID=588898 RepID=A0A1N7ADS3_9EURY|nr:TetR/AcrR family transcriptional regulator [Natronorubrum daqingense]APX98020.1 TetR family transcriptional regulator [Natronorubrum daqingense]SIR37255.1 transcriptional regulator, TetR family [Natronorubrum daqingense]
MTDADTRHTIMAATYEALCEVGYSDLTAQAIADRTDRSKSALFYHYDSREELVAAFIEYLIDGFDGRLEQIDDRPPLEQLTAFVDWFLSGPDDDQVAFHTAFLELRAQAPYNELYREKLRESDDRLREAIETILRNGIESGDFQEHDPETVAALLLATFDGARIRQFTLGRDEYLETVREETAARILADVLAPGVELPAESQVEFPRDERFHDGDAGDRPE